jgi:hypothetical protein
MSGTVNITDIPLWEGLSCKDKLPDGYLVRFGPNPNQELSKFMFSIQHGNFHCDYPSIRETDLQLPPEELWARIVGPMVAGLREVS